MIKTQKVEVLDSMKDPGGSTSHLDAEESSEASVKKDMCAHPAFLRELCVKCGQKVDYDTAVPNYDTAVGSGMYSKFPQRDQWKVYPVWTYTQQEKEIYDKKVKESQGFDCGYVVPGFSVPGMLVETKLEGYPETNLVVLNDMAVLAIQTYNELHVKAYEFVKLIKLNSRHADNSRMYYITFQAKEDGFPPQSFQAVVVAHVGDPKQVMFCRLEGSEEQPYIERIPFVRLSDT